MIARVWRGWTDASRAGEYVEYLNRTGVPGLRGTPGNLAVYVLHRLVDDDRTEFVVMSLWDSLESVKAFAGDDVSIARFYPRDDEFLVERKRHCDHYEVPVAPER
jgi:heme-degrading monooxygenase HmoA